MTSPHLHIDRESCAGPGADMRPEIFTKTILISLYPALQTADDAKLCTRFMDWALAPLSSQAQVVIPCAAQAARIWPDFCEIADEGLAAGIARKSDAVLIWNAAAFWGAPAWLRRKAVICDPFASCAATDMLSDWVSRTSKLSVDGAGPPRAFTDLIAQAVSRDVLIIGTSPGQSELLDFDKDSLGNPLCLYMSGAIENAQLLERFPPDIIVAADGASQFSGLDTARRFKSSVEAAMRSSDAILIVPAAFAAIMTTHWSREFSDRVLTLPYSLSLPQRSTSLQERWAVYPTGNIVTTMAIPIAAALSRRIRFAGVTLSGAVADGTVLHWQHANAAGAYRKAADILAFEPGSVLPQAGYLERHFARLKTQLLDLEAGGYALCDYAGIELLPIVETKSATQQTLLKPKSRVRSVRDYVVQKFEKAQHFPHLLAVFLMGVVLSFTVMMLSLTTLEITLGVLAGLSVCILFAGLYVMRLRMNRMMSAMEGRLSRQQAAQFENISERLKHIEALSDLNNRQKTGE